MTKQEAYRILGLSPDSGEKEIKKRYRQLMRQVHPDIHGSSEKHYTCHAQQVNHAYTILKKSGFAGTDAVSREKRHAAEKSDGKAKSSKHCIWNAPVNSHAYCEREIFHHVEDFDGAILGEFCIASGKYFWSQEEDFPLFLKSVYLCGKRLMDEADMEVGRTKPPAGRGELQAELTYLLAQQFIDGSALLKKFAKSEPADSDGNPIFSMPAMLEYVGAPTILEPGEILSPAGIRQHRLYLKNRDGRILGYLSFPDDRLYYIIIPLFEHKLVLVKIRVAEKQPEGKKDSVLEYQNLHLFLKPVNHDIRGVAESLTLQIERLLKQYKEKV